MKKYRAIIIDDELASREVLKIELKQNAPDVEIVSFCKTYKEAEQKMAEIDFDIAFIDITMPGGNGLDLLRNCDSRDFYPIMVTSHIEYAVEAIKEEAFDYILKPFTSAELNRSLDRIRAKVGANNKIEDLNNNLFEAKDKNSSVFINQNDIDYLQADGSYTTIHYNGKEFVMSKNLKYVSSKLNGNVFFRCSNQVLVNTKHITKIDHKENIAHLKNGEVVSISVRRKDALFKMLRK